MPNYLNPIFAALADPTRRHVVEQLAHGPASVSALAKPFDMSLPAFVQHLTVLEKSGLVGSRKEGRVRTCYLQKDAMDDLDSWVRDTMQYWDNRLDALTEYAESKHAADKNAATNVTAQQENPDE